MLDEISRGVIVTYTVIMILLWIGAVTGNFWISLLALVLLFTVMRIDGTI